MQLMNVIYVSDMPRSVVFYESIGLRRSVDDAIDPMWNEFGIGDARLALHTMSADEIPAPSKHLELHLQIPNAKLEQVFTTCEQAGHPIGAEIQDIGFGRFFWITDPDGLWIQFNGE